MKFTISLTGTTPLLMHRDNLEWGDRLEQFFRTTKKKGKGAAEEPSGKGDDRRPGWKWLGCLYHDGKHVGVTFEMLLKCLAKTGGSFKVGKGTKTYRAVAPVAVQFSAETYPVHVNGKPIPVAPLFELQDETDYLAHTEAATAAGFKLFAKRAPIGQNGKHVRVRPLFANWSVPAITGELDESAIPVSTFKDIVETAGRTEGLGDWRPGSPKSPGYYGMFTAKVTAK